MIATVHLFPVLDEKLLRLLRSLNADDWDRPATPKWTVKDVAAHLLDGNIRTLSMLRDGYFGMGKPASDDYADVLDYINTFNAQWVSAARRLSPALLTGLLEITGKMHNDYYAALPLYAVSPFAVSWAGEQQSMNWFHIAREYTEKWHHQQQIRKALGRESELYSPPLYRPYLETSMRAFPHHYRDVKAVSGDTIRIRIDGEAGGDWFLAFRESWQFTDAPAAGCKASIHIPADIAWQIFTRAITPEEAKKHVITEGPSALTEPVFTLLAVMA
ncbi:MAG: maleylpyruvate isomerase N-terminal domain-containing protein [Mucilaginibacter polytrichastri]|nr:maleylpyruvate isomerase N-terminal domain-containing protein [Mucilaginibacter polytrichastri]